MNETSKRRVLDQRIWKVRPHLRGKQKTICKATKRLKNDVNVSGVYDEKKSLTGSPVNVKGQGKKEKKTPLYKNKEKKKKKTTARGQKPVEGQKRRETTRDRGCY